MSISGIADSGFDYALLSCCGARRLSTLAGFGASGSDDPGGFMSALKSQLAEMQFSISGTLPVSDDYQCNQEGATGRNMALFDPESAYRMMTVIRAKDMVHKAEFTEMSEMKSCLETMRQSALELVGNGGTSTDVDIATRLQSFVDAYNGWIDRFDQDLQPGGLLAGTQAAQVAQWELEQSVENFFNGAAHGLHGMRDLGILIDPVTNLAALDRGRLESTLSNNKEGAVAAIREFSGNFAKSAELLVSDGNFVSNRLDNLDRVIDYFEDNRQSLQREFGLGDAYQPSGQVARALKAYNTIYD